MGALSFSWLALVLGASPTSPSAAEQIQNLDASAQLALLQSGQRSSLELTQAYLLRIEALDQRGPKINAVIERNPDALKQAQARDLARKSGRCGALCGLPILLKDNIDVAGPMATSAGSLALAHHHPLKDAELVQRLLDAGVVILGKTNLSEWANFRSSNSSSGWSSRGGQTRNPHVLDRSPCGSSAGSGAAMAARFAALTVGTETDGSIICPASINGVVGMKPGIGVVSQRGIIPISHSQDSAGPMTASVRDAALLLGAMTATPISLDFTQATLAGKRFGIVRKAMGFDARVDALFDAMVLRMRAAGAELMEVELAHHGEYRADEFTVLKYEFKAGLNEYLGQTGSTVAIKSLTDLIGFNQDNQALVMPWFGQETLLSANALGDLSSPSYLKAARSARQQAGPDGALRALKKHRLDALIAPSNAPAWRVDWVNGDNYGGGDSAIAAVAGYPSITVPMGQIHRLPVGISMIGAPDGDNALLQLAYAFEQLSKARIAPAFRPSLETP